MRHRLLLALLFSCGLACAETNLAPSTPSKDVAKLQSETNQYKGNSESNKDITKGLSSAVEISKLPVIQIEAIDKTEKVHDYFSSEWWLVYITGALAIFTGLLYSATVSLGKEAKETSERQAGEMEKSLAVAKESADAATRTVETMESTAERQLRAYVFATSDEPMTKDSNGALCATITIKNYGQTPAHEVRCAVLIGLYKYPLDERLDEPDYVGASKSPLSNSVPIKQFPTLPRPLNSLEIEAILAKKSAIFVWGEIAYVDIFKKDRRTKFRLYSIGDDLTRRELAYHHEGNDAD